MVKTNHKKHSLRKVLLSKLRQDLKQNIFQYLAIILIAALSVSLFTGLGANYRVFQSRVKQIYKEGNISDLWYTTTSVTNKVEDKVKQTLTSNDKFEKRLIVPVNISDPVKKDSVIDNNYSLYINDENHSLNHISRYYKVTELGKKEEISPIISDDPVIYLPYMMIANTPVESKVTVKIPFSLFITLLGGGGYVIELDNHQKPTGKIINKNEKKEIDLTRIASLSYFIKPSHLVNGDKKNNLLTKETVLNLLSKATDSNTYFEMNFTLGGYVEHPESAYRNSIVRLAYTKRNDFLKAVNNSISLLETKYSEEVALARLFSLVFKIDNVSDISTQPELYNDLKQIEKTLSKRYTSLFFDHTNSESFIRKLEEGIGVYLPIFYPEHFSDSLGNSLSLNAIKTKIRSLYINNFQAKINYFKDNYYNQFVVQLANHSKNNIKDMQHKIDKLFDDEEVKNSGSALLISQNLDQLYSNQVIQSDVIQSNKLMYVFPLIFFVVSFLVIISTTSQMILKERIQIGTLKSLGITKHEITLYYCLRSMLVVFIGIAIGFLTGPFIIPFIIDSKYKLLYNLPPIHLVFPWLETIVITVVFLLLVGVIVIALLHEEIKQNPSILMRPKLIQMKFKPHNYRKNTKSISSRIAMRNIRTNKFRSLMTVVGVMGCCALVLVGLGINDTVDYGINHDVSKYYNCDLVIRYKAGSGDKISSYLTADENISHYESFYSQPITISKSGDFKNKQLTSFATSFIHDSIFYKPSVKEKPSFGKTNISKRVAENIGVKVGDKIKIITFEKQEFELEIERIVDAFFVQGLVFNLDDPACKDLINCAKICYVKFKPGVNHKQASQIIEQQDFVVKAYTSESNEKIINDVMGSIKVATITILVFAISLAAIVLYNLIKLNLNQRQREIATLKVLGFNHYEITESIKIETMLLTIVGIILGLGLGYPFLMLVMKINETDVVTYLYKIFTSSFVLATSCLFLASYIISTIVANSVKKFKMVEMLKSVE